MKPPRPLPPPAKRLINAGKRQARLKIALERHMLVAMMFPDRVSARRARKYIQIEAAHARARDVVSYRFLSIVAAAPPVGRIDTPT